MNVMCSRKSLGDSKIGSCAYRNTDVRDTCKEFEQHCFTRWDSGGKKAIFLHEDTILHHMQVEYICTIK